MAARGKPATDRGAKLLDACERKHGGVAATARAADVQYRTLARLIFSTKVARPPSYDVVEKLEKAGIPRILLGVA